MAKKKAGGEFVLAAAVRDALTKEPTLSANQMIANIRKAHPSAKFNEASAKVAFSNLRGKLGIARKRRKVRRVRLATGAATSPRALKLELLQSAKNLLIAAGSPDNAIAALKQVASLQVK